MIDLKRPGNADSRNDRLRNGRFRVAAVAVLVYMLAGLQPIFATKVINDDATGGDCTAIGTWTPATKTCTLTGNVSEAIQIAADSVILDGAGFSVLGSGGGVGVQLSQRTGVTLRNLDIRNFTDGIELIDSSGNTVVDNTLDGHSHGGILLRTSTSNELARNTVTSGGQSGIWLWNASNSNTVSCNTTSGNNEYGIFVDANSDSNVVRGNVTSNDQVGIRIIFSSDFNTVSNNSLTNHTNIGLHLFSGPTGNQVYNNNFFGNVPQIRIDSSPGNTLSLAAPVGGNYYDDWDTPPENCADTSPADGFCDTPRTFGGTTDLLPLTNAADVQSAAICPEQVLVPGVQRRGLIVLTAVLGISLLVVLLSVRRHPPV